MGGKTPQQLLFTIITISILINACGQPVPAVYPSTATPEPTPTPTPSPTPVFSSIDWELLPISDSEPGPWDLYDPYDGQAPVLLETHEGGYKLIEDWRVNTIEFVFSWGGIGNTIFNYQFIDWIGGTFYLDGVAIPRTKVEGLLSAIKDLSPGQRPLAGIDHSDDYPHWEVHIRGEDDQYIILASDSTANPNASPWNVFYNGRAYLQVNGLLGEAISELFDHPVGFPAASAWIGGIREENTVYFNTPGTYREPWPGGLHGLALVSGDFGFKPNLENRSIEGYIVQYLEPGIIGFSGLVQEGKPYIQDVDTIRLQNSNIGTVNCSIAFVDGDYENGEQSVWEYSCPVGNDAQPGKDFLYDILIYLSTPDGEDLSLSGEIFGQWSNSLPRLVTPLPETIAQALDSNAGSLSLMENLIPYYAEYMGNKNVESGAEYLIGEIFWLGAVIINGREHGFTLATGFSIDKNGNLSFEFDIEKLNSFLRNLFRHRFIERAYEVDPDLILNLRYIENQLEMADTLYLETGYVPYQLGTRHVAFCRGLPGSGDYPRSGRPFQGFSFNWDAFSGGSDFLLEGQDIIFLDLTYYGAEYYFSGGNDLAELLIPVELNTGDRPPFRTLSIGREQLFAGNPPSARISLPWEGEQVTSDPFYAQLLAKLPVGRAPQDEQDKLYGWFEFPNLTAAIEEDGSVHAVQCR